jgi:hypothetical protein
VHQASGSDRRPLVITHITLLSPLLPSYHLCYLALTLTIVHMVVLTILSILTILTILTHTYHIAVGRRRGQGLHEDLYY